MNYEIVDTVYNIPVHEIYVDPSFNCRGFFTPESVRDLAHSIRDHGLLEPIVVQPLEDIVSPPDDCQPSHKWRLIAGHRREAGVRLFLRWDHIPTRVIKKLNTEQALTLNFLENLDRKDLNMLQEAQAIRRVWPDISINELSRRLKKNVVWVFVRKQLVHLSDEIQQAAASKRLTQHDIEFIARAHDPDEQQRIFQGILDVKAKKTKEGPRRRGHQWSASNRALRNKVEIGEMITYILELAHERGCDASIIEAATGALSWAMRGITAEDFLSRLNLPFEMDRFND